MSPSRAEPLAAPGLTRKGRATRERIVAIAARLMYEKGPAATSVEDVQQSAGVSASQIYHYFGDKAALTRAVVAHQTDTVLAVQTSWMNRLDSVTAFRDWRDFMVDAQQEQDFAGCPIGSLAGELSGDAVVAPDLAQSYRRWQDAIRAGLTAMQERGELKSRADPEQLSLAMLAAIQGGLLMARTQHNTTALEAALDTVIDRIRDLLG